MNDVFRSNLYGGYSRDGGVIDLFGEGHAVTQKNLFPESIDVSAIDASAGGLTDAEKGIGTE